MVRLLSEETSNDIRAQRERYAILKQLYPVNALALTLVVVWLLLFSYLSSRNLVLYSQLLAIVVSTLPIFGLWRHASKPLMHQESFEKTAIANLNSKRDMSTR